MACQETQTLHIANIYMVLDIQSVNQNEILTWFFSSKALL